MTIAVTPSATRCDRWRSIVIVMSVVLYLLSFVVFVSYALGLRTLAWYDVYQSPPAEVESWARLGDWKQDAATSPSDASPAAPSRSRSATIETWRLSIIAREYEDEKTKERHFSGASISVNLKAIGLVAVFLVEIASVTAIIAMISYLLKKVMGVKKC